MPKDLKVLGENLLDELRQVNDLNELKQLKAKYLGKNSELAKLFNKIKQAQDFKLKAEEINKLRAEWTLIFKENQVLLEQRLEQKMLEQHSIDVTLPCDKSHGTRHPVNLVKERLVEIMRTLGYKEVQGREIEDNYHNFIALNVPDGHPARGMQDTFYLGQDRLLRTQTSSVQIHQLKQEKIPLKIISAGRVYRRDADQTHSPMFHQLEMLNIDKNCNFSDLKALLLHTFTELFQAKLKFRFRPSYFPFTEPSGELDIEWQGDWLEVAGYGMVHPNVLEMQGIDTSTFNGYAFGVGLDRLAMILYGIKDLRLLFQNDLRFLSQFKGDSI